MAHLRKARPSSNAQSGTHFPNGMPSGKRSPESRLRVGQTFRLSPSAETASRNECSKWDALSKRPADGKRIPFWARIPGRIFRLRGEPESASRSEAIFWDELSARRSTGNGIPFWSRIPGHAFRLRFYRKACPILGVDSGTQFPLQTKGPGSRWSRGQRRSVCS